MALEGGELTTLTVEQKSEGVQHRDRVATPLAQEKKSLKKSYTWYVLVIPMEPLIRHWRGRRLQRYS